MTVPVISRQIWNRWAISWRYSGAGRRWRLGRKGEGGTGAQAQEQEAHRIHEESQQRVCEPDEEAERAWASSHSQGTPPNYRSLSLPIVAAEGRNVQSDEDGIFAEHRWIGAAVCIAASEWLSVSGKRLPLSMSSS